MQLFPRNTLTAAPHMLYVVKHYLFLVVETISLHSLCVGRGAQEDTVDPLGMRMKTGSMKMGIPVFPCCADQ